MGRPYKNRDKAAHLLTPIANSHTKRPHGECRLDGLSVIDASVMPTLPTANTNLPTIMVAEHMLRLREAAGQ